MVKVLHEAFGIESGLMTTIHAYTATSASTMLLTAISGAHRAAALSTIPTSPAPPPPSGGSSQKGAGLSSESAIVAVGSVAGDLTVLVGRWSGLEEIGEAAAADPHQIGTQSLYCEPCRPCSTCIQDRRGSWQRLWWRPTCMRPSLIAALMSLRRQDASSLSADLSGSVISRRALGKTRTAIRARPPGAVRLGTSEFRIPWRAVYQWQNDQIRGQATSSAYLKWGETYISYSLSGGP
ncbi:unnamed protein product, partial [Mesorhabditis spiculigera]